MKLYEYDNDGWLIGWHEDTDRPNSTTAAPEGLAPRRARWNGSAWADDASRETQEAVDDQADRTRAQAAIAKCKAYDPATATAADVRTTLGAALHLIRNVVQELRP